MEIAASDSSGGVDSSKSLVLTSLKVQMDCFWCRNFFDILQPEEDGLVGVALLVRQQELSPWHPGLSDSDQYHPALEIIEN